MIDIHTHMLPAIDDGAETVEEATQMAEVALRDGVTTVVATPHSNDLDSLPPGTLASRLEQLKSALEARQLNLTVMPGLENYLSPDLAERWQAGRALTLGESPYMLIEFPLFQYPLYTEAVLFELQIKGVMPIIAHPERNEIIQQDIGRLHKLVERGILSQVTTASLVGGFGSTARRIAENLLARNLAHIIATDAHSPFGHRNPRLSEGIAAASRIIGYDKAMAMVTAIPEAVLAGKPVHADPHLATPHPSWAFWRR
ncbi:MAG: CpsB/CapC family capsule biosynthesis tyrosine phosphatase [Chloroflexota bacterium]